MADLDISEHRKPQDGKIDFARFGGPAVELRAVTVPTARGLKTWCCACSAAASRWRWSRSARLTRAGRAALGDRQALRPDPHLRPHRLRQDHHAALVLRDINTVGRKIWTAEDPVEITQDGLRQVQVNARIGWTFAAAMRTSCAPTPTSS